MAKTNRTHTLAGLTLTWWILKTVIVGQVFTPCEHLANARLGLSLLSNSLSSKCHGFNKNKSEVLVDCMISFVQICSSIFLILLDLDLITGEAQSTKIKVMFMKLV